MTRIPSELCTGWLGHYQLINGSSLNLGTGQCLDLTPAELAGWPNVAGYLQQDLNLDVNGFYSVSYRWGLMNQTFSPLTSFQLTTWWNGVTVDILNPSVKNMAITQEF